MPHDSLEQEDGPLLRDPPPPPGWVDPLEDSEILQDPARTERRPAHGRAFDAAPGARAPRPDNAAAG
jgi:hypothetical protein